MQKLEDVHKQFASFFGEEHLKPYLEQLWLKMSEGHICLPIANWSPETSEAAFTASPIELSAFPHLIATDPLLTRPFILHKSKLYLHRYFTYETSILHSIERLLKEESGQQDLRKKQLSQMEGFIKSLNANYSLEDCLEDEKIDWQTIAAIIGFLSNFSIITGGPGTGKTTTVAKILSFVYTANPNAKVALAAPTGKAAVRMATSLKETQLPIGAEIKGKFAALKPHTIHKLLRPIRDSIHFKHNAANPLPFDLIIVDEASMIDVALFSKLLESVGSYSRIILLGDRNQLASVEVGSLLGDFCRSLQRLNEFSVERSNFANDFIEDKHRQLSLTPSALDLHPLAEHVIELQKSHRFNGKGGIGKLSRIVINGNVKELKSLIQVAENNEVHIDLKSDPALFETYAEAYVDYIKEYDIAKALKKLNNIKILCAVRDGEQGLYAANKKIEQFLKKKNLLNPFEEFYHNRPIIVTRNMPELGLFNGDIGLIRKDNKGNMKAWFEDSDGKIRSVLPGYISDAETVFAMTIHKSQGSEYDKVLVLLPEDENIPLLTRELLYTAITRAKSKLLLQATESVLLRTVAQQVERVSGISERFDEIQYSN